MSQYSSFIQAVDLSHHRLDLVRELLSYAVQYAQSLHRSDQDGSAQKNVDHSNNLLHSNPSNLEPDEHPSWISINLGWRDVEGGHTALKNLIAELGGLLLEDIMQLKVKEHKSLILVDKGFEEDLIAAINGETFQSKRLIMNYQSRP